MFVVLFIYAAASFAEDISASPPWFYVVFSHTAFMGMTTNLLLGVYALRTANTEDVVAWGESASMWLRLSRLDDQIRHQEEGESA